MGTDQRPPASDLSGGPAMHADPLPEAGQGADGAGRRRDPLVPQPPQPLHENQ